jgi:hypothetical protein
MAQTYFGSTLRAGSGTLTDTVDGGFVVMMQTSTVTTLASGAASSVTEVLPAGSQIINIFIDTMVDEVVGGSGTATAIAATVGTAAAGTQYVSSTDVFAGGRFTPTFTTAQLAAMADIGANINVVLTVDPNGTIVTTQGVYRLTVVYAQKV